MRFSKLCFTMRDMDITVCGKTYRVTVRVGKLILWLLEHMVDVSGPDKCQLEFNLAGEDLRTKMTVFY